MWLENNLCLSWFAYVLRSRVHSSLAALNRLQWHNWSNKCSSQIEMLPLEFLSLENPLWQSLPWLKGIWNLTPFFSRQWIAGWGGCDILESQNIGTQWQMPYITLFVFSSPFFFPFSHGFIMAVEEQLLEVVRWKSSPKRPMKTQFGWFDVDTLMGILGVLPNQQVYF